MKNLTLIKSTLKDAKSIIVEMQIKRNVITESEYIKFIKQVRNKMEEIEELLNE